MSWWRKLLKWGGEEEPGAPRSRRAASVPQTPEQEFQSASAAYERRDSRRALHHLAEAIAADPAHPERLRLLEEILSATNTSPEQLLDENDQGYYAAEALRAYALHRSGRTPEALELLLAITRAKPDAHYLEAWAVDWLEEATSLSLLDADLIGYLAGVVVTPFPEHHALDDARREWLERLLGLMERFRAAHPVDAYFRAGYVALLRKLGRFDEALAEANRLYYDHPEWQTAVAVANVERYRGEPEHAIAWFETALKHDPEDVTARNDIADLYLERADWRNALRWYEEVLQREPRHPWALPSAAYCRWKLTQDEQWLRQMEGLAAGPPSNDRAASLLKLEPAR